MKIEEKNGSALIVALSFLAVLMILTSAFVSNVIAATRGQSRLETQTRSFYVADAGLSYAVRQLDREGADYKGESQFKYGEGYFDISITEHPDGAGKKIVTSTSWLEGFPEKERQSVRAVIRLEDEEGKTRAAVLSWNKVD